MKSTRLLVLLLAAACTPPVASRHGPTGPTPATTGSGPPASSGAEPATPPPQPRQLDDVQLVGESPTDCYCMDALATADLGDPSLQRGGAPTTPLAANELLLVTRLASYRCAIPGGVGVPTFDRVEARGADVVVDLTWRGFMSADRQPAAVVIPAPGPGGRVQVHLHDSWMGGRPEQVEDCTVTVRAPSPP